MPYRLTKCVDHDMNHLSYLAFFEDVEIRKARGERQYKCAECGLWQWPRHPARSVRQSESKSTEHQPVDLLRPCPFAHWWYLPREHRRRLRNLFAYQFTGGRLAHLTDAEPRCAICRSNLIRSVA